MDKSEERSRWKVFRSEVIKLDGSKCVKCGRSEEDGAILQVHHTKYYHGVKLWDYAHDECETLCKGCHAELHGIIKPRDGWQFEFDEDLGDLTGECEHCGTSIRYVFYISHVQWRTMIGVGTNCCDNLTGTDEASSLLDSRSRYLSRKNRFVNSAKWDVSQDGRKHFLKKRNHEVVIHVGLDGRCVIQINSDKGKNTYQSLADAKVKAFNVLDTGEYDSYLQRKILGR